MGRAVKQAIPDTSIFDLRLSRRGVRLNRMCFSLCDPRNRDAFKQDEDAYIDKVTLSDDE